MFFKKLKICTSGRKRKEAEAVKDGSSKISVCTCMYDMGCLCPQLIFLSSQVNPQNLPIIFHPVFSLSQFFLPVLFLFIFFKPCLYLWIRWVHSYTSRISTLRLDCTNYTSKLGNWISYSASGLERENTGIIVTDRDTPTLWCHRHSGPVFPIDKSRFMIWPPWLFSPPKRFISFISWETAVWG